MTDNIVLWRPGGWGAGWNQVRRYLGAGPFDWVVLGQSAGAQKKLEKESSTTDAPRRLSIPLRDTARRAQPLFLEALAAIPRDDLEWWANPLSEKNPDVSRAFLHLGYCLAIDDVVRRRPPGRPLLVVAEDAGVFRALGQVWAGKARRVDAGGLHRAAETLAGVAWYLYYRARFLTRHLGAWFQVRWQGLRRWPAVRAAARSAVPMTLILTWADARSVAGAGSFRDFFFIDLRERLRSAGANVAVLFKAAGSLTVGRVLRRLRAVPEPFLEIHAFVRWTDIVRRWVRSFREPWERWSNAPRIEGVPLAPIFEADRWRSGLFPRTAEAMLYRDAVRGMSRAGLRLERVIFPYENVGWEKILCASLREYFPSAVTVGYQHSRLPSLLPNYYFSPKDRSPRPDFVVANGPAPHRRLLAMGYPPEQTLRGGALRYDYLRSRPPAVAAPERARTVLVAFSIGIEESRELLRALLESADQTAGLRVWLKCHPATPLDRLRRGQAVRPLPGHFREVGEPIGDLTRAAGLTVYTTSTSCLEALAGGSAVAHFVTTAALDTDPLDAAPDARYECFSAADLGDLLRRFSKGQLASPDPATVVRLIDDMFGPVNDETLRAFRADRGPAGPRGGAGGRSRSAPAAAPVEGGPPAGVRSTDAPAP